MKYIHTQKNKGFTLVETMVAVFILTLALSGLLSLNASSIFQARYARNEITANYLLQEAADSIRNNRDTTAFLHNNGGTWTTFLNSYGYGGAPSCFSAFSGDTTSKGCSMDFSASTPTPIACTVAVTWGTLHCPVFYYDSTAANNSFYNYTTTGGSIPTDFKRQILMSVNSGNPDELDIKITVEWLNGSLVHTQSLQTSLFKWQP